MTAMNSSVKEKTRPLAVLRINSQRHTTGEIHPKGTRCTALRLLRALRMTGETTLAAADWSWPPMNGIPQ